MPFEKGNNANPRGRPKGVGRIKADSARAYESITKVLGSEATAGRVYELMEVWCKTAKLPELLSMIERFNSPVLKEMVKKNQLEITASDELADALRSALTADAKAKHDRNTST